MQQDLETTWTVMTKYMPEVGIRDALEKAQREEDWAVIAYLSSVMDERLSRRCRHCGARVGGYEKKQNFQAEHSAQPQERQ
jgi:hypothetical protein